MQIAISSRITLITWREARDLENRLHQLEIWLNF